MASAGWGPRIRARTGIATAALLLCLLAPAAAHAASGCNAEGFCVHEGLALQTNPPGLVAASPLSVDLSLENASEPLDRAHWMSAMSVALPTPEPGAPPPLTPSAALPDKLLIAGGGTSCAAPEYAGCGAGHGTLVAHVTPILGQPYDTTGAFGIEKIANVNPPKGNAVADYMVKFKFCFSIPAGTNCSNTVTEEFEVFVGPESNGELKMPTEAEGELLGTKIEFSIKSILMHFDGQSNRLDGGGTTPQAYTVVSTPIRCGAIEGTATFSSHERGSVSLTDAHTISGCPTAALSPPSRIGATVTLDGGGSTTPVAGRAIASWHWSFGDGTEAVTATPTVSHDYWPGSEHTVTLFVADSAGALSEPVTEKVTLPPGSLLTVSVSGSGTVAGPEISCPPLCSAIYPTGSSASLAATPAAGSVFAGWGGDCTGTGGCQLQMATNRTVTASFLPAPAPQAVRPVSGPRHAPATKLGRSLVKGNTARFAFSGQGRFDGFECALLRPKGRPRFSSCRSPKRYRGLRPGRYVFEVRAVGPAGTDPTPARRAFSIRRR